MKRGDWVVHEDGRLGRITMTDFRVGYHLVDFLDNTFARATYHLYLKPFDPAVSDILTAVNTNERE